MRTLFNDNWMFLEMPAGTDYAPAKAAYEAGEFAAVEVPHDWLIDDCHDLYRDGTGWYRKEFAWAGGMSGRVFLIFDGVYMDSAYYLNGKKVFTWKNGYTRCTFEITDYLKAGVNELMVSVTFRAPNSRWYSGAGIERNVWLMRTERVCIPDGGIYVSAKRAPDEGWDLYVRAEVLNPEKEPVRVGVSLFDKEQAIASGQMQKNTPEVFCRALHFGPSAGIEPWDITNPKRYRLEVRLLPGGPEIFASQAAQASDGSGARQDQHGGMEWTSETDVQENVIVPALQTETLLIGFRETAFDPDRGFFLNGRHVKIQGVCLHTDHGALGNAFHEDALRRQLRIMKEMGVNAVRFAHNPFADEALALTDEMGLLAVDECFDMWEMPKNRFDYARFFPEWQAQDVASFVRRDRNHPSLILWSIGNEIYDQHAGGERGAELTRMLCDEVRALDPMENARVTTGSNYMPWENAQRCADLYGIVGYNYAEKYYDAHHRAHPGWVIYGSETCSICSSRGVYHFPLGEEILSDEDGQCSALGNSITSWGARSIEECVCMDRDLPYSMGQFLWAGMDYLGEPTPYHTKNSYLGMADTAGFPKDLYYVWQSAWTDGKTNPMIHVFPYWDFCVGQEIDVRVCSNAPVVELFVNGRSLGRQRLDHEEGSGHHVIADWKVPYEPGGITAAAYDEQGEMISCETRHSFGNTAAFAVRKEPDRAGRLRFYEIYAVDADGYPVENATDFVRVDVRNARLLGLDNGDSTDRFPFRGNERHLFSGKLLAIVELPEGTEVYPRSPETFSEGEAAGTGAPAPFCDVTDDEGVRLVVTALRPAAVRKITVEAEGGHVFTPDRRVLTARALVEPADAGDRRVVFSAVDDRGVPVNIVALSQDGNRVRMTAKGDGTFHLRCTSESGSGHVRILSQIDYRIEGLGPAYLDPYGFVYASLYTDSQGEVGCGNEKGIATARDQDTTVTWSGMDFGPVGSDKVTIPIFALTGEAYPMEFWEGIPGQEGAQLLLEAVYCKPSKWNVYQEETFTFSKRLTGMAVFSIRVHRKMHIKGFTFARCDKAWMRLYADDADEIYGDSFRRDGRAVREIGNNVSLLFHDMEFAEHPLHGIRVCGSTPLAVNTIHLRFRRGEEEEREILEFRGGETADIGTAAKETAAAKETFVLTSGAQAHLRGTGPAPAGVPSIQDFPLRSRSGKWEMTFVFLPGSRFDLEWFELY